MLGYRSKESTVGLAGLVLLVWTLLDLELVSWAARTLLGVGGLSGLPEPKERALGEAGRRALAGQNAREAQRLFEAALAIDPHQEYRRELAQVLLDREDLYSAEKEARRFLVDFPDDGLGHLLLAAILEKIGVNKRDLLTVLENGRRRVAERLEEHHPPGPHTGRLVAELAGLERAIRALKASQTSTASER